MPSLLIVAHAPLASSLMAVARHVYPDCESVLSAVDVDPALGLSEAVDLVKAGLTSRPDQEWLILTDVFGATPCNAVIEAAAGSRTRIVAGLNVPMLWRTLCYADLPLDELVQRALNGASSGIMHVGALRRQNQTVVPGRDAQHPNLHQQ